MPSAKRLTIVVADTPEMRRALHYLAGECDDEADYWHSDDTPDRAMRDAYEALGKALETASEGSKGS